MSPACKQGDGFSPLQLTEFKRSQTMALVVAGVAPPESAAALRRGHEAIGPIRQGLHITEVNEGFDFQCAPIAVVAARVLNLLAESLAMEKGWPCRCDRRRGQQTGSGWEKSAAGLLVSCLRPKRS